MENMCQKWMSNFPKSTLLTGNQIRKKIDSLEKLLILVINKYGKDIFNDTKSLKSSMIDLAPNLKKEIHIFLIV
jgi:hypothetical protein